MTLKDIIIAGKLTISEGGGGGGAELDALIDRSIESVTTQATTIGTYAFRECTALKTFSAPNATEVKENGLENCYLVESISMPKVTKLNSTCFSRVGLNATNKPTIILPNLTTMAGRGEFKFARFAAVDIGPNLTAIMPDCFYNNGSDAVVQTLILRSTAGVVTAGNAVAVNALRDVYVPSALIASYTADSTWGTYIGDSTITLHAIEGSIYETKYADGTPIA